MAKDTSAVRPVGADSTRIRFKRALCFIADAIRNPLRPIIHGTPLYRALQIPSKLLRKHSDSWRIDSRDSIFRRPQELPMCSLLPTNILNLLLRMFDPASVLDVGCGTGKSLDYLLERGVDAIGIEGSRLAVAHARNPERIVTADLNQRIDLKRRFDVVFSFEVIEHIHPDYVEELLNTLMVHSDVVVLSHAQPGQGGEGHFNEQSDSYWIEKFQTHGFGIDLIATEGFKKCDDTFAENMLVFRKTS